MNCETKDNMKEKLVSVIIPTYNRADLITETIESILAQTYGNIEIIVVDDGSTDETFAVVKRIKASRLKYIKTSNSGRPAIPRNIGFGVSCGEYIAFLDSDDIWLPDKIKRQMEIFEKMPEVGLVFCQCNFFGKEYYENRIFPLKAYSGNVFEKIIMGNFVPTVSALCRRTALQEVGLFDESLNLRAFEDYELWMRMAYKHHFYFIGEPLCLFRMHAQNILGTDNLKSHLGAFRALCSAINKIGFSEEQLKNSVGRHYLTTAMAWLEVRNFRNFERHLDRALSFKRDYLALGIKLLNKIIGNGPLFELYSKYRAFKRLISASRRA